ncbi:MAG: ShlB/FhaC/HecB family hemolysin secretion/activation protein, partial [Gemmatimonadota bacterium]
NGPQGGDPAAEKGQLEAEMAAVEEQEALVAWQLPNDLRVDVVGRRYRSRNPELTASSVFDRPWFVPRSVGDSVRIFSNEFPATGALHPLARGAESAYHYDLLDSLNVSVPGLGEIRLYSVEVTPKRVAPALVAGRLWLDAETAQVVRFTFRYVGTSLWVAPEADDSGSARLANSLINRIVSIDADLEYSLQDGRYWMPYRQAIAGTVRIPIVTDVVIPFQAVTTFDDYEINTGTPVVFSLPLPDSLSPDSARRLRGERRDSIQAEREGGEGRPEGWHTAERWPGGRFEMHRPPDDTLALYAGWRDSLRFDNAAEDDRRVREAQAELARISEGLPDELTGRSAAGFGYQNLGDALQYNRVQGYSLGVGGRARVPGSDFTDVFATVRYGFSDERITGRLAVVRDAPGGRIALSGYRDVTDVDPFSPGRTLANSFNAIFTAHDEADYLLATGGSLTYVTSVAVGTDLFASVRGERQRSVTREARSGVNDFFGGTGDFPANPPIAEGDYGIASLRVARLAGIRWSLALEGMAGEGEVTGRIFGDVRYGRGGARGYTVRLKAGVAESAAPPQMQFRLGGMQSVRGFQYGSIIAPAFWAAQLDVSPLRGTIRPIVFIDAGQAAALDELFESRALVGGGIGVSIYSPLLRTTLIRLDLSHPISPDEGGKWRFDIVFSPVR